VIRIERHSGFVVYRSEFVDPRTSSEASTRSPDSRRGECSEAVGAGGDVLGPGAHVVEPVHRVGPSYGLRSDDFYAAHPRAPDCGPTRGLIPVAPSATPDLNLTFPTPPSPGDSIATGVGVPLDHPVAVCWCERQRRPRFSPLYSSLL